MQLIKDIIVREATKSWKVPSKSKKGKWHTVSLVHDNLRCDCFAGQMQQNCTHKQVISWKLNLSVTK